MTDFKSSLLSFLKDLYDYKFRKYITRRIIGVIYAICLIVIPAATFYLTYQWEKMAAVNYESGLHLALIGIWIAGPIIGFIVLIWLRLILEAIVALVNIAENTEPK